VEVNGHRRIICVVVCVLLFTSAQQVWADSRLFSLKEVDSGVTKIEYRLEGEEWREADLSHLQITVPHAPDDTKLLLRQYRGSEEPGATFSYRYDKEVGTWIYIPPITAVPLVAPLSETVVDTPSDETVEITLSPYVTLMITDNNLRHMYTLPLGIGLDASLSFPFQRNLIFKTDVEIRYAKSNNIWADCFLLFGGDVGIGYRFQLGDQFHLIPSLSYGVFFHLCVENILEKPISLTQHAGLDIEVGYSLTPSLHVVAAPHVQMMIDTTRSGFLYGLRAGVGFVL